MKNKSTGINNYIEEFDETFDPEEIAKEFFEIGKRETKKDKLKKMKDY